MKTSRLARGTVDESAQDMFACLDTLGAADS